MFGCTSVKLSAGMCTFQISFLNQHHNREWKTAYWGVIKNAKKYFLKGMLVSHLNTKFEGVWFQFGEVMPPPKGTS
jgi:hypothetical protein